MMTPIGGNHKADDLPTKILQYGEGNFLRAFVDYMVDVANKSEYFGGKIHIVKPIPQGSIAHLRAQSGKYTVLLRGKRDGEVYTEKFPIDSVSSSSDAYADYDEYSVLAKSPDLRFIVSNTTEAGIVFDESDDINLCPPNSFPGKLTKFLFERYEAFDGDMDKGLIILPVELIENNGRVLSECCLRLAETWNLPESFSNWLKQANIFCNTLVDRIVTGFPAEYVDNEERLLSEIGWKDSLVVAAEPYALWVIETDNPTVKEEFPLDKAGLPVIFTSDLTPYRERKVRLLNGTHTASALAAYLSNLNTVGEMMADKTLRAFIDNIICDELSPMVPAPKDEVKTFAKSVIERFENPFIKHNLLSISLNSVSKFKVRVLPTILETYKKTGRLPSLLCFSLAALITFYSGGERCGEKYEIIDDAGVLDFFSKNKELPAEELTQAFLSNIGFWGEDLTKIPSMSDKVSSALRSIQIGGMRSAIESEIFPNLIRINPKDNVAVAVSPIKAEQCLSVDDIELIARNEILFGHKIALCDIKKGAKVIKYGYPIGFAITDIKRGEHVHSHNLASALDEKSAYSYTSEKVITAQNTTSDCFMGFKRKNGKVGIRNEIWIVPTVGCVNPIGDAVSKKAQRLICGSIDGVHYFPHPYGCSQLGNDHENTKKAICGLINHPNAGGVLVLGLGCENNGIDEIKEMLRETDESRVKFLVCQDSEDEITEALSHIENLIETAKDDTRENVPMSELIVGLKCGGSDGLSGITANPLVGLFTNRLIRGGGSAILTEVPEMFGAETILMNRCINEDVFDKTVSLINNFKEYFISHDQPINENPSPGNKDGGITTLEEKSLGCTQKCGDVPVTDVLSYGEILQTKGLNLLESPGNDLVAVSALAISGCHLILFTTGRGTPFGSPVPTVKISSNSLLAEKKKSWIDINAGELAQGIDAQELAAQFYEYVCKLASGKVRTITEKNDIKDFTIFKTGITL